MKTRPWREEMSPNRRKYFFGQVSYERYNKAQYLYKEIHFFSAEK